MFLQPCHADDGDDDSVLSIVLCYFWSVWSCCESSGESSCESSCESSGESSGESRMMVRAVILKCYSQALQAFNHDMV